MPKAIPDAEHIRLKPAFVERYKALTGHCYDDFIRYSLSYLTRSFRVNTLKTSVPEIRRRLEKNWVLKPIPWCSEGFWISGKRRDVGNLIEHTLGYIYVQEAASMLPPLALSPQPGERVLDMCASPGSKTTQMAAMMKNTGALVANDINGARMAPLGINLQRAGVKNTVITQMKGHRFAQLGQTFDRILVDAPCSGTGTIRKSLKTLEIWNPNMVRKIAATQKRLLDTAFTLVENGGTIVYSTCSLEPEENEGVVDWLLQRYDNAVIEKIKMNIKRSAPIMSFHGKEYDPRVKETLRLWPQDNDTEGFFVAKLRKE